MAKQPSRFSKFAEPEKADSTTISAKKLRIKQRQEKVAEKLTTVAPTDKPPVDVFKSIFSDSVLVFNLWIHRWNYFHEVIFSHLFFVICKTHSQDQVTRSQKMKAQTMIPVLLQSKRNRSKPCQTLIRSLKRQPRSQLVRRHYSGPARDRRRSKTLLRKHLKM